MNGSSPKSNNPEINDAFNEAIKEASNAPNIKPFFDEVYGLFYETEFTDLHGNKINLCQKVNQIVEKKKTDHLDDEEVMEVRLAMEGIRSQLANAPYDETRDTVHTNLLRSIDDMIS